MNAGLCWMFARGSLSANGLSPGCQEAMLRNLYLCGLFIAVLTLRPLWWGKNSRLHRPLIMVLTVFFQDLEMSPFKIPNVRTWWFSLTVGLQTFNLKCVGGNALLSCDSFSWHRLDFVEYSGNSKGLACFHFKAAAGSLGYDVPLLKLCYFPSLMYSNDINCGYSLVIWGIWKANASLLSIPVKQEAASACYPSIIFAWSVGRDVYQCLSLSAFCIIIDLKRENTEVQSLHNSLYSLNACLHCALHSRCIYFTLSCVSTNNYISQCWFQAGRRESCLVQANS